jgi:hypothetical protein
MASSLGHPLRQKSSFCCYKDKSPLGIPPGIMQKMKVTKAAQTTEAEYAKDERDKKVVHTPEGNLQKEIQL